MSKSRQELLAWVNELLQTNYIKIEQLGTGTLSLFYLLSSVQTSKLGVYLSHPLILTILSVFILGAAYCQIMDSIYNDVPLRRVKFSANQEYEYISNFKILQNAFTAHSVSRPVNAAKLSKLKFQDNFEFLQWLRVFWEQEYSGEHYDAIARRKAQPIVSNGLNSPRPSSSARGTSRAGYTRPTPHAASVVNTPSVRAGSASGRPPVASAAQNAALAEANNQISELKGLLSTSEEERGYYYEKLRSVESFLQQYETHSSPDVIDIIKSLQDVLYNDTATEISQEHEQDLGNPNVDSIDSKITNMTINEEETF
ncbi:hypothetical protein BB561_002757 [Smittium simulii]|uniref:EB1 C-terminal domain-containing protein n=1 Tax=Smittium simulii TaxID=133385 RepID=A0A2T9YPC1_9FUNG|nr:hypothetical protein BB561_002757 [Smittium simulii]